MSFLCQFVRNNPYLCATMEYRRLSAEEYADLASRILYEDNHLLVICKKAGEIVQGD